MEKYLNNYGNSDSLFLRLKLDNSNYYGFVKVLFFDFESEYYLLFKEYNGNTKVYNYKIDDNTNLTDLLSVIPSYEDNDKFSLINNKLSIIKGSQLFSFYLDYGFYCDIYIQKVNDNQNIISFNNIVTGNLVKLLMPNKVYYIDFNLNHMIKLDNDYTDAQVTFYDKNNKEIGALDMNNRYIHLNGSNIKVSSNEKNALIYFYSIMESDKKNMYEIIFEKSRIGKNMKFNITNKDNDDQNITLIKDYGFENYYPMLNSKSWDKILIEKGKTTTIYIENPYDKLDENELNENEQFIIYIANAFDEEGRPYFEEEKFEIKNINYNDNSISKYNKFNFQVIEMNKNKSIILSQSNKNKIYYQMTFCNRSSYSYYMDIDYSNSNIDGINNLKSSNQSVSINLENYEIMNHKFYRSNGYNDNLLFYYSFENNVIPYKKSYVEMYLWLKALDEKYLDVRIWSDNKAYYKMYIVVALVDDNNKLSTFNQHCYLSKLITENINSNYILKILYYDFSSSNEYILKKIDISSLNTNTNNKFVLNVIAEDLSNNKLQFNSALECIPEQTKEIQLNKIYTFGDNKDLRINNYFKFNYNDENQKEFVLALKTLESYNSLIMDIYIEGPEISIKQSINKYSSHEICFNLTKSGVVYFKFVMKGGRNGKFNVLPLKKTINIIDFKEKIYFYQNELFTE